jgi:hypothetical protein
MKCTVEIGSGGMIHVSSVMKIGSGIQNLIRDTHKHTYTWTGR